MSDAEDRLHRRSRRHLLFPLASFTPVQLLRSVAGLDPLQAIRVTMAAVAAVWAGSLFLLLRLLGCAAFDGLLFCLLAIWSAAALFWFSVPETWGFGSTTLVAALAIAVWRQHREDSERWLTLSSALTLSMTSSNWMMGWAIAFTALPWRRALRVTAMALALVIAVWAGQKAFFPSAKLTPKPRHFTSYAFQENSGSPASIARAFFLHVMVMPEIGEGDPNRDSQARMTVQNAAVGSGSRWGELASVAWLGLLAAGACGIVAQWPRQRPVVLVLVLTLSGQLVLHLVYGGEETFLYGLHWIPLLIAVAAFGSLTKARYVVRMLAALCLVLAALNNERQFGRGVDNLEKWLPSVLSRGQGSR